MSDRKRTPADFFAQAPVKSQANIRQPARRAHEAAVASAYYRLGGPLQSARRGRRVVGAGAAGGRRDLHCYCCMLFFDGAGGSKGLLKDGHRWCMPCSYEVHGCTGAPGARRWPAQGVRDHRAPQQPLRWLLWLKTKLNKFQNNSAL
jgi:hypothetical protein